MTSSPTNMAAERLPSEFDVVILGTGLVESIVAAACSRVGQRVLHLDRRSYYAGKWASFTLNGLLSWIEEQNKTIDSEEQGQDWSSLLEEGEDLIGLSTRDVSPVTNLRVMNYTSEEEEKIPPSNRGEEEEEEEDRPDQTPARETEEQGSSSNEVKESSQSESSGPIPSSDQSQSESSGPIPSSDQSQSESSGPIPSSDQSQSESSGPIPSSDQSQSESSGPIPSSDQSQSESSGPIPSSDQSQSENGRKRRSYAELLKEGRRFNIDLVSKLLYSRGSLIDLLIKSNVSRYAEFKNVTRVLTCHHGNIQQVPCSRADVFSSKLLSVVEKRMLMRFLTSCLDQDTPLHYQDFADRPYLEFLQHHKLSENLQHFLLHSISMATPETPTATALTSTRHFLQCLGRYGNTPFLFPLYGLGEIPQCFCRMCAVFGGIYCLRHSVQALVVDRSNNMCKAVIDSQGQRISCSHVVLEEGCLTQTATPTRWVSRAVLITDGSVLPSEAEQQEVSIVTIPSESPVRLVELNSSTMTCMPGTNLVHLTCQSLGSAFQDLSPVVTRLFQTIDSDHHDPRPAVLWCLYFNMSEGSGSEGSDLPSNLSVCPGPDGTLGHDRAIAQAELIFQKILPEEDFCPPAPNPEDVLYPGEEPETSPSYQGVEPESSPSHQEEPETLSSHQEEQPETSPSCQGEEPGTGPSHHAKVPDDSHSHQGEGPKASPSHQGEELEASPIQPEDGTEG